MPTIWGFGDVSGRLVPDFDYDFSQDSHADNTEVFWFRKGSLQWPRHSSSSSAKLVFPSLGLIVFFGAHCQFNPELLPAAHEDAQTRARHITKIQYRLIVFQYEHYGMGNIPTAI
jgi:hypothetical protein